MSNSAENYNSQVFRISHRQLAASMLLLYSSWALITISVLALPALLAGIFLDLRWLVVFMMVIFLFTPMLLTFLYFFHGLRFSTSSNVVPHALDISSQGIKVTLFDKIDRESDMESREEEKRRTEDENGNIWEYRSEKLYSMAQLVDIKVVSTGEIIQFKHPEKGFIWISPEAFSSRDEYCDAMRFIRKFIDNEITER